MKRFLALLSALCLMVGGATAFADENGDRLCELAAGYGFKMGAALSYDQLKDQKYLDLVLTHFNSITATNEMKAYSMLDQGGSRRTPQGMPAINFTKADQMVAWAQEHGLGVRGHVLVWDAYMTEWYFHETYVKARPFADRETILKRTEYYITEVITHFEEKFPGVVYCWDVVNEAVADGANECDWSDPRHLRTMRNGSENLFQKYMGDDYVAQAFLFARNAVDALGADIRLYYNDYNAYFPEKAAAIRALAESVNTFAKDENGNYRKLMDGIGMQGYIGGYGTQSGCLQESHLGMIRNAIKGYADMGLEVQITEMAVRNFDRSAAARHAKYYGKLFKVFMGLNTPEGNPLNAVTIWGITDYPDLAPGNYTYDLNSPFGGLVDENLDYKDAFYQVLETLKSKE